MWVRRVRAVGMVIGIAFVGLFAWVIGLRGLANRAESICFADLDDRPSYGGYRMSAQLWPPSFECNLVGTGADPLVVGHPVQAVVWFGWAVVVPVASMATLLIVSRRRRQLRAAGA